MHRLCDGKSFDKGKKTGICHYEVVRSGAWKQFYDYLFRICMDGFGGMYSGKHFGRRIFKGRSRNAALCNGRIFSLLFPGGSGGFMAFETVERHDGIKSE